MTHLLLVAALVTQLPDHVCINSVDIVGFETAAGQAVIDNVRNAFAAAGVTTEVALRSNPADDRCRDGALGVLHLTAVRAGDSVLYELRSGPNQAPVEFEHPLDDPKGMHAHIARWVEPLRAGRPRQASTAAPAAAVTMETPPPAERSIGWGPIVLWSTSGAMLLAAGGFRLNAGQLHEEGDFEVGEKRYNTSIALAALSAAPAIAGLVWWLLDEPPTATVASTDGPNTPSQTPADR